MKAETISTVSENLLTFLYLATNFFLATLFNDFTSLSDDLEKSRARSPEAQFFFRPQLRQK